MPLVALLLVGALCCDAVRWYALFHGGLSSGLEHVAHVAESGFCIAMVVVYVNRARFAR
jgi:hypothetical protein